MLDTLSHLGIDAWLQSSEGTKFRFTNPPVVEGNQITAVIEVKRAQKYAVHWSTKSQDTPASNAWGTIHRPKGKNRLRPFPETRHMSENDSQTQSWSIPYDSWFCTPQNTSFIILKIQHLRDPPTGLPEGNDLDSVPGLLDREGAETIFRFEFKLPHKSKQSVGSSGKDKNHFTHEIQLFDSELSTSESDEDVKAVIKERKTCLKELKNSEKEKKLKRAKRGKVLDKLAKGNQRLKEKKKKNELKGKQYDDEIRDMEAVLDMEPNSE